MYIFIKKILATSLFTLLCLNILAQDINEEVTYNEEKGIFSIRYLSSIDSVYYTVPFFPGDKIKPNLKGEIMYNKDSNIYTYNYYLSNSTQSKREIYVFLIPLELPFEKIEVPNDTWTGSYLKRFEGIRWVNSKSRSDTLGVLPGRAVDGSFLLSSQSPPRIIEAKISSYQNLGNTPDEGPTGKMRSIVDSLFTATEAYYEKTIGPSSNSTDLSKEILLKRLNSYVSISCNELGWITNQGICNSLEVKLRNVERYLENEKPKQAANALNAFLKEVEAQKDKALSSEAYALLYFNGQYLLEKLKANEN